MRAVPSLSFAVYFLHVALVGCAAGSEQFVNYVRVTKADHVRGGSQRESNLYYLQVGSTEGAEIDENARGMAADKNVAFLEASKMVAEDVAKRELSRLGLCDGNVQIAGAVERWTSTGT